MILTPKTLRACKALLRTTKHLQERLAGAIADEILQHDRPPAGADLIRDLV
jgi:hypothetical protein